MGGGVVSRPPDYKSRMVKLHGPEGASGAQRRASQGLRPPPQSQSAPYLVLCYQRSAGFQMRSAGRQKSSCAGSLGNIRGLQPSPSAGPEFRPTPHPVSALSARARYALIIDRGPELSRRGPGNQDALREAPSEGRERSARSGPPTEARTRSRSSRKKGGGGGAAVRHDRRSGSPEVPCTPVLSPLGRGELPQPPLSPRTPREPARAENRRRQASWRSSASRAPAAAKPGSNSAVRVPGGKPQGSAPSPPHLGWIISDKLPGPGRASQSDGHLARWPSHAE
ncbi:hypothetical protein NDU88_006271 [Pleurodeles waltl]|uniref:Uncharacterized protein n=1 Tax=Pleurodeles waltl TaxID=8319 RepID=A0AAV7TWB7_PLEWA|nr:hypothetical protein NDU88_006271 [Pleurodeles waltl]